jgi:hypothetical protein
MRIGSSFLVSGDMPGAVISGQFGFLAYRLLAQVGMQAARSLYHERLDMTLNPRSFSSTGAPLSKTGRRMVSFSVAKDRSGVIIRSYPLNVLRRGPGPRTAKRTYGKKILRSFAKSFDANAAASDVLDKLLTARMGEADTWATKLRRNNSNRKGEI